MKPMDDLLAVMARLRDPDGGCPWDLEQDFRSIAPYTIEEAYEVADAIEREDMPALQGELGDLLFQVVFHSRMAEEQGLFDFDAVAAGLCEKMRRRHPHVFGDATIADAASQADAWERMKEEERRNAADDAGILADVPANLPALSRAARLGRRASGAGFDWPDASGARAKVAEELAELDEELDLSPRRGPGRQPPGPADNDADGNIEQGGGDGSDRHARQTEEFGDLLFALCNLARHFAIDPEAALRGTNARFERRFAFIEEQLRAQGRNPQDATLAELDALWEQAKVQERSRKS